MKRKNREIAKMAWQVWQLADEVGLGLRFDDGWLEVYGSGESENGPKFWKISEALSYLMGYRDRQNKRRKKKAKTAK